MTLRPPEPGSGDFVHLHVHSEFSLLDGLSRIGEMTMRVADQGMTAMALTDHGSMYGVIPFYAAAKTAGIKPIIGIEAYVAPRGMADKEGKQDADYHHMILLARDDVGYRNLLALTTAAHLDGYYYKPRIDKELLARHSKGLIGTSACLGGEVLKRLAQGDERGAAQAADEYRSILGAENFFIEVQDHGIGDQQRLHPQLVELARRQNIPLLATNDTHYTTPEHYLKDAGHIGADDRTFGSGGITMPSCTLPTKEGPHHACPTEGHHAVQRGHPRPSAAQHVLPRGRLDGATRPGRRDEHPADGRDRRGGSPRRGPGPRLRRGRGGRRPRWSAQLAGAGSARARPRRHTPQLRDEGSVDLKLYTVYAPPQHAPGTVHRTKAEADADDEHA